MTRPRLRTAWLFSAGVALHGACAASPAPPVTPAATAEASKPTATTPLPIAPLGIADAERALAESRYAEAEVLFRRFMEGELGQRARLGLARALMSTGRHAEAQALLRPATEAAPTAELEGTTLLAHSLWLTGNAAEATRLLESLVSRPEARRARLLLGEIHLAHGRRADAEPLLMTLIEDYNADRIGAEDGPGLALVGRAAHLLRSPHDANDAFNAAERAAPGDPQTLLWRAELFLEKHDPGHAEEVVEELLERAPAHPEALVWMAHVKLEQALDFDAARALVDKALAVNAGLPHAYFVLAGIELRDLEFKTALGHIERGLQTSPQHLDLLSMRAAVAFLAEDQALFESTRQEVLSQNPSYSRFYSIVGQFAEWEHRYERIVTMMREAVAIDDEDAEAHAALGLNLIRGGQEAAGVQSLRRAGAKDPFNVRVYNTLNLYEQIIPEGYITRKHGRFLVRYPKAEAALLERYVPKLLDRAYQTFSKAYGFTPSEPIGIELYELREHFSVRTSGLPQTAIQGVCFGKTLASLTPRHEAFNLGMTLWHELAHVFHIQMSESHVPRWLTEGLAEYETLVAREEWRRHHDPDLFLAWRSGRLPQVGSMNRAFSHAEDMQDMATAYYASSQIAVMLVERYGRERVNRLLRLQARGVAANEAMQSALGVDAAAVDREFAAYLERTLSRYERQFVPLDVRGELPELVAASAQAPKDVVAKLRVVLGALRDKELELAKSAHAEAAALDATAPDVIFLGARLSAAEGQDARARAELARMIQTGHDGYAVQMSLAELTDAKQDPAAARAALRRAHELDATQSEPLRALLALAEEAGDRAAQIWALTQLARLEEHDPGVYRRLLAFLVEDKSYGEALKIAEAAVYADIEGAPTHVLYAQALAGVGRFDEAAFEFESAALTPSPPSELAAASVAYADFLEERGQAERAAKEIERARELDPEHPRFKPAGAP